VEEDRTPSETGEAVGEVGVEVEEEVVAAMAVVQFKFSTLSHRVLWRECLKEV
jgi:hypothetical protein